MTHVRLTQTTGQVFPPMKLNSPMNVVLTVCGKVIVNDQGNLLHINSTSLWGRRGGHFQLDSMTRYTNTVPIINVAR